MELKNKVAMITGAAVGIGRACALLFAKAGAKLVLLDVDRAKLENVKNELSEYGDDILIYECDVSDEAGVKRIVEDAFAKFGHIDILVNNAAIWRCWQSFVETRTDDWKRFIDINVMGTVYCIHAVLPAMLETGYGRIINVASVAGVYGNANMALYSATKGAVISLTKALAKEVADKGVTVNSVSPGTVSDSRNPDIDHYDPNELSYMGRSGTDRENAELILFLAGDKSAYISGQNIQIDGCRKRI